MVSTPRRETGELHAGGKSTAEGERPAAGRHLRSSKMQQSPVRLGMVGWVTYAVRWWDRR